MHLNMLNMFMINLLLFYQPEICFFFLLVDNAPTLILKIQSLLTFLGWTIVFMKLNHDGKADKKHPNTVYHFISIPAFRYSTLGSFPLNLCYYTKHTKPTQSTKGNNSAQKVFLKHYTHLHLWAHVNRE